jgi:hypothetical protein
VAKNQMNQQERDPFDYFRDEKTPQKPEEPASDDIVTNLRSDLLAASEVEPAKKSIFQQVDIKLIVGVIIALVIICVILYLLVGAGRSVLEKKLVNLKQMEPTFTQQIKPTPIPATFTPPQPSNTPSKSPTVRPTNSVIVEITPSPTNIPATLTPTSGSGCRDALTITLADVGQTLCVQGTVIETIANPTNFMVIFNTEKGSFYWVTYDLVWSQAELDTCYQTTGTIDKIANSPILVFGYSNLPEPCP